MTTTDTNTADTTPNRAFPFSPVLPAATPVQLEHRLSTTIPGLRLRMVSIMLRIACHKGWIEEYCIYPSIWLTPSKRPHNVDEWGSIGLYYWWGVVMFDAKGTRERLQIRQPLTVAQQQRLSLWGKALDLIFGLSRVRPVVIIMPPRSNEDEVVTL